MKKLIIALAVFIVSAFNVSCSLQETSFLTSSVQETSFLENAMGEYISTGENGTIGFAGKKFTIDSEYIRKEDGTPVLKFYKEVNANEAIYTYTHSGDYKLLAYKEEKLHGGLFLGLAGKPINMSILRRNLYEYIYGNKQ